MTGQDKSFNQKLYDEIETFVKDKDMSVRQFRDLVVSLVRELVGDKRPLNDSFEHGWNACRTEILSRLEEGK